MVVPPQAATGPLTLAYPGGRVAVPGVFTFRLSPPVLTGVEPLAALPGAEVTLTGRNLLRASQVTFGGVSLEGRFTVVSDTEVRVRMSDDGEAGTAGLLGIVTPAGATVFGQPCRFLDSRIHAFRQFLAGDPEGLPLLGFEAFRRAAPYGLKLPLAPVFHPLYPSRRELTPGTPSSRPGFDAPTFTLGLHLPQAFYPVLPAALRARIEARNIPRDRVDILVSSQDNIYDGGGGLPQRDWYEFKPQYWLYQDVPFEDYPLSLARIEAGLFRADTE